MGKSPESICANGLLIVLIGGSKWNEMRLIGSRLPVH